MPDRRSTAGGRVRLGHAHRRRPGAGGGQGRAGAGCCVRDTLPEDPGAAAVIKLLNNYLLLAGLAVLADVVAVAQATGFEKDDIRTLLENLPVVAPGLKNRIDGLLGTEHEAWFSVDLGSKDVGLFTTLAEQSGVRLGVAGAAAARYDEASKLGLGDRDLTAVIETLRRGPS
jgi:3-hydroxyisobutyrate dehydrogenase-like beta-hydroxyacid dehydrogenase